jgi:diguanylate cyclase (GGDEF)-like protein
VDSIGFRGRLVSVVLVLLVHTAIGTYVAITEGSVNLVTYLGYPIWCLLGYWIGKKYDQVTFLSDKDPLTNLYNRRYVMKASDKMIALAKRRKFNVFLLMIDCDDFKEINDRYSHYVGDLVLSKIGAILLANTRKSDLCARWGGDEFLVMGFDSEESAEALAQRMEEVFSNNLLIQEAIEIRVSIGGSVCLNQSINLEELIKIADKHMYARKFAKKAASTS